MHSPRRNTAPRRPLTHQKQPQSPMQSEAPGQTQGSAGVPLPLSSDEDDESMDLLNSRKRLREESGDEDDHAPRKQTATTPSDEKFTRFSGLRGVVRERV
ncbi:hypothetical protein MRX96_037982 [Rhipicephalus microplus]